MVLSSEEEIETQGFSPRKKEKGVPDEVSSQRPEKKVGKEQGGGDVLGMCLRSRARGNRPETKRLPRGDCTNLRRKKKNAMGHRESS